MIGLAWKSEFVFQNFFDFLFQFRQSFLDDFPNNLVVNVIVSMNNAVAQTSYF